jgi:general nucleoside transport system permease protein
VTSLIGPALRAAFFVLLSILACAALFQLAGYSATAMFGDIARGAFLSPWALTNTMRWTLPLFITSVGVVISFRAGYFNVGAQGQFYAGAIATAFVAEQLHGMPTLAAVPLIIIAATAAGCAWGVWPGWLRVRFGSDEVITTLMGNFIASLLLSYVTSGPLKDPAGTGQSSSSRPIEAAFRISGANGISSTIVACALLVGVLAWLLANRTAFGLLSGLVGRNPIMMMWQGAKLSRYGLASFALAGALAGLTGALEVLGPNGRLVSGFLPNFGFTTVIVALVSGLAIGAGAVVAVFFGGLTAAALYIPVVSDLPASAISIINAAVALLITAQKGPRIPALRRFRPQRTTDA